MSNIIKSETIKTDNAIHTIAIIAQDNGDFTRTIMSTDPEWHNKEVHHSTLDAAQKRYDRDLAALKPAGRPTKYGINKNISYAGYIRATVTERVLPAAQDELHEQAVQILNETPEAMTSDKATDAFITRTERDLIDETIRQLQEYRKSL